MEQSETFKSAAATIKLLESKLAACSNNRCEYSATQAEKEIEEYFAKCMNALATRKADLLREVKQNVNHQSMCKQTQSIICNNCWLQQR